MSEQEIRVPGKGVFRFPGDMSDDDISKAFRNHFPEWYPDPAAGEDRRKLRSGEQLGPEKAPSTSWLRGAPEGWSGIMEGVKVPVREQDRSLEEWKSMTPQEQDQALPWVRSILDEEGSGFIWDDEKNVFKSVMSPDEKRLDGIRKKAVKDFWSSLDPSLNAAPENRPLLDSKAFQAGKGAVVRQLMSEVHDDFTLLEKERERIEKAANMVDGEFYMDKWDHDSHNSLIERHNKKLAKLAKEFKSVQPLPSQSNEMLLEDDTSMAVRGLRRIKDFAPALLNINPDPGLEPNKPKSILLAPKSAWDKAEMDESYLGQGLGYGGKMMRSTGKFVKSLAAVPGEAAVSIATGDWTNLGRNYQAWINNAKANRGDAPLPFDRDLEELTFDSDLAAKALGMIGGGAAEAGPWMGMFSAIHKVMPAIAPGRAIEGTLMRAAPGGALMGFNEDGTMNLFNFFYHRN